MLRSKEGKKVTENQFREINRKLNETIRKRGHQIKADITYRFHCTPHTALAKIDFDLSQYSGNIRLVEIKAHYKDMPQRILRKINQKIDPKALSSTLGPYLKDHLMQTTSQQLTRKAGLTPKEYAKGISETIKKQTKVREARKRKEFRERGRIRRRYKPKQKPRRPRPK